MRQDLIPDLSLLIFKFTHEFGYVLRPECRVRHREMSKRSRRSRLDDKSALTNLRHEFLKDVKFRRVELIISKV
jgi:hypothetical protein